MLDLKQFYARYGLRGAPPYAPEILLGLLFYAYATGIFSSRKIEKATYDSVPFRFIAGNMHIDHDTIANFRKHFIAEIKNIFIQILLIAHESGVLKLGNISIDGSKIHADASKSKAVSYKHLLVIESRLLKEIEELLELGERADRDEVLPKDLIINDEIKRREGRLTALAKAKAVIEERAATRYADEKDAYTEKMRLREEKKLSGHRIGGREPAQPTPGPQDKDQYNFTDPESQIMKNSTNKGFDQHYNVQVAVDQESFLIVGNSLSNHTNDQAEIEPTFDSVPTEVGKPSAAALDSGYFSDKNIKNLEKREIEPYIATGRDSHFQSWKERFLETPEPPPDNASPKIKMAFKLKTEIGAAIYRLRKCTVEPVIGIIKEALGFRQFSLRGEVAAAGEWSLVCIAFDLKRLKTLLDGKMFPVLASPTGC